MDGIDQIEEQVASRLGRIRNICAIEGGFSTERKYRFNTGSETFLLRLSPIDTFPAKQEEFDLIARLHSSGVRCNKPVQIFKDEMNEAVYSIFQFLPGFSAEGKIAALPAQTQYEIGYEAGEELRRINRLERTPADWKLRKWRKHERLVGQYRDQDYRFPNDEKVLQFIGENYDRSEAAVDCLQHDDFHLGNIIVDDAQYVGVIGFNRYDWGDPLHEWVKLEWFTWQESQSFAKGQFAGYYNGTPIDDAARLQICVYIAMSIFSTIVWTRAFSPNTFVAIERRLKAILKHYEGFDKTDPEWSR